MKPRRVRVLADGSLGVVRATHRDFDDEPLQHLIRFESGDLAWMLAERFEIIADVEHPTEELNAAMNEQEVADMVARRFVLLRKERGMTQEEFARHVGIPRTMLADLETARKTLLVPKMIQICMRLEITPDELFGFTKSIK